MFPVWLMSAMLALVTIVVYWPAVHHGFVDYDDPLYVTDNPLVRAGLSWEGLSWAFGRVHGFHTYWHPLTWVSHMVDCQLYGPKPYGHHLTSVLLHAANVALVFLVFRRMTGAFWRCVVLAALFGVHPLQVDSVAWVAERKNLLSAGFWLLTLYAYARYAQGHSPEPLGKVSKTRSVRPTSDKPVRGASRTHHPSLFYILSLFFMACGLMCKPVLVTLPIVLLLLDYWPLRRFQRTTSPPRDGLGMGAPDSSLKRLLSLLWEKVPFFALAAASSVITLLAHQALGMLNSVSTPSWDARLENALVSYVRYLGKTFWPSDLAVFYPYPSVLPMWEVIVSALLLIAISGVVLRTARSRPWLFVGWFWFLGVLVPFIGLIQAGEQAMADRFIYVPALGVFVALIWGLHGWANDPHYQVKGLLMAGSAATLVWVALTRQQLGYWEDGETLFRHALAVTENNYLAHLNLGSTLNERGQVDEAIREFKEALRLKPGYVLAYNNLGVAVVKKGQIDEGISYYREAIRLNPSYAEAHSNLGLALGRKGQLDEAIREFQEAIHLKPDFAEAHSNLGMPLVTKGRIDAAIQEFQTALRLKPDSAEAHSNLGMAFARKNQLDKAIQGFQDAIRLKPDFAEAHYNLGLVLARNNQLDEAISEFQQALRLKPDFTEARTSLALAIASKNRPAGGP
jgi:tetratricopeptide (TPR) repeat protein